jgi:hypothetical protein
LTTRFVQAAFAVILVGCGLGCSGSNEEAKTMSGSKTDATPSTTSGPVERQVASRLGPAPTNCRGSLTRSKAPGFGLLLGKKPVWFGPYARYDRRRQTLRLFPDTPKVQLGWRIKVLWLVWEKQEAPVTIKAGRLAGAASPPLIQLGGEGTPRTSVSLDPKHPGAYSNPHTADFPSYIYFSGAGCIFLQATWPEGNWRAVFGVGR